MDEYIARQAALDALQAPEICNITPRHIELIKEIPTADVATVIHAHWAQTSKGVIYCSNCGAVCGIGAHIEEVTEDHYFCYYCGAKMDEEDTHE